MLAPFARLQDADLVIVEFSFNDDHFEGFWGSSQERTDANDGRRGYESLLRRLLALPGRPAVVTLAYFGWYYATTDGLAHPPSRAAAAAAAAEGGVAGLDLEAGAGGLFFESAEGEQAVVAQVRRWQGRPASPGHCSLLAAALQRACAAYLSSPSPWVRGGLID